MQRSKWSSIADLQERIAAFAASGRPRPFVTLTYAQSLDGSISAERGAPLRLSGETSMTMTHELRAMHDGILVGVGTVIADNPSLTVRLVPGSSPRPVILDSKLRCPVDCKLVASPQCVRPVILTTVAATEDPCTAERRQALQAAGAVIIACAATPSGRVDFADALRKIPSQVQSIMVEGGAAIISDLLSSAAAGSGTYVDYVLLTIAPVLVSCFETLASRYNFTPVAASKDTVLPRGLQVGGLRAVENLLPRHQVAGREDGTGSGEACTDFPRLTEIKVDVLDGADVVIGGVVTSLCHPQF